MIGFRPKTSDLYIERLRLLKLLPDSKGYVVWLEAPYGYGKTVLTSQWAESLEKEGWRVLWLSVQGRNLKHALCQLLELSPELAWGVLLDQIWAIPSLLVLEDLEGDEVLSPLLKDPQGLILLASRTRLKALELSRLKTQQRLIYLSAPTLAFTEDEAMQLFIDKGIGKQAWQKSQGWSLPLHFAALTGELPKAESILEGIRESLSEELWQEALFLASLPYLPYESFSEDSKALAQAGLAQELEVGLRLHSLASETILQTHLEDSRAVFKIFYKRLPLALQAEGLAKLQLSQILEELLERNHMLAVYDPERYLFLDKQCPEAVTSGRLLGLGWALSSLGLNDTALVKLDEVISHPETSLDQRLLASGWLISILSSKEEARVQMLLKETEPLLLKANPKRVVSFLINASAFYYRAHDWLRLEQLQNQALVFLKLDESLDHFRSIVELNLAEVNWELRGNLNSLIAGLEKNLPVQEQYNAFNVVLNHYRQGMSRALLGDVKALEHFEQAEAMASQNLREALLAQFEKAAMLVQPEVFAELKEQSEALDKDPEVLERLLTLWARTLRQTGQAQAALNVLEGYDTDSVAAERALALAALGKRKEAFAFLTRALMGHERFVQLELQAARYLLSKKEAELDTLIALSLSREQILPVLIPFSQLPQKRPELAKAYPLQTVLASSWQAAIRVRQQDIPPLELYVLNRFELKVLGKSLELSSRQKEILSLLVLRVRREEIAEMLWSEIEQDKQRNNLNVQLNLLRKELEPWGLATYLSTEGLIHSTVDLWQLETALANQDAKTATQLYRIPFAPGIYLDLVEEARERLKEDMIQVLFKAAQTREDNDYLERILKLDPVHEEALQLLIQQLLKRGRRREAHKYYEGFAHKLKLDMGLEPLKETQALLF